jgi:hypothetical protein
MAKLKRRPDNWEEIKGIGKKRSQELREELGEYRDFAENSTNFKKNAIAKTVSGNRRNLPQFAQNAIDAGARDSIAVDAVDDSLVRKQTENRTTKSKTVTRREEGEQDRSDLGFETQQRSDVEVDAAFDIFTRANEDEFDAPAGELGRFANDEFESDFGEAGDRATFQPLIGAATSRTTFGSGAQAEDFRDEISRSVEQTDRATASPGEIADAFTEFTEQQFGFGVEAAGEQVDRREMRQAEEAHEERSRVSRRVDNNRKAEITRDADKWLENPDKFDFPGVDTPEANDGDFQLFNNG